MSDSAEDQALNGPQASEHLQQELAAAIDDGLYVAAIVDPASFAQAWSKFAALAHNRGGGSLFADTPQVQDTEVAPLLVPLQRTDRTTRQDIARIALQSPAVVWLASSLPPADLLPVLSAKLHAELAEDRQLITLRYFDPRVLPELLRVLDAEQQAHLNAGVRCWWWFDRRNLLVRHDPLPAAPPVVAPMGASIALTEEQVQSLLDASFVDRVLDVLARSAPTCLQPFDRAQRQAIATQHTEAAAQWGLTSEFDCASYIAVSLQQGPDFATSPAWTASMDAVKAGTLRFSDAIEQWENRDDHSA